MCGITAWIAATFFGVGVAIEPWVRRRAHAALTRMRHWTRTVRMP